jgi:hypothetical protein
MPYQVCCADNWDHHEGAKLEEGVYPTAAAAIAAARRIVDRSLEDIHSRMLRDGSSPKPATLYARWCAAGENSFIFAVGDAASIDPRFDPYAHAEKRAGEIAG